MELYPERAVWDELVYLAYHLHWDLDKLLDLEHADRIMLVERVAEFNRRALDDARKLLS
jgi:hypothetical protein